MSPAATVLAVILSLVIVVGVATLLLLPLWDTRAARRPRRCDYCNTLVARAHMVPVIYYSGWRGLLCKRCYVTARAKRAKR